MTHRPVLSWSIDVRSDVSSGLASSEKKKVSSSAAGRSSTSESAGVLAGRVSSATTLKRLRAEYEGRLNQKDVVIAGLIEDSKQKDVVIAGLHQRLSEKDLAIAALQQENTGGTSLIKTKKCDDQAATNAAAASDVTSCLADTAAAPAAETATEPATEAPESDGDEASTDLLSLDASTRSFGELLAGAGKGFLGGQPAGGDEEEDDLPDEDDMLLGFSSFHFVESLAMSRRHSSGSSKSSINSINSSVASVLPTVLDQLQSTTGSMMLLADTPTLECSSRRYTSESQLVGAGPACGIAQRKAVSANGSANSSFNSNSTSLGFSSITSSIFRAFDKLAISLTSPVITSSSEPEAAAMSGLSVLLHPETDSTISRHRAASDSQLQLAFPGSITLAAGRRMSEPGVGSGVASCKGMRSVRVSRNSSSAGGSAVVVVAKGTSASASPSVAAAVKTVDDAPVFDSSNNSPSNISLLPISAFAAAAAVSATLSVNASTASSGNGISSSSTTAVKSAEMAVYASISHADGGNGSSNVVGKYNSSVNTNNSLTAPIRVHSGFSYLAADGGRRPSLDLFTVGMGSDSTTFAAGNSSSSASCAKAAAPAAKKVSSGKSTTTISMSTVRSHPIALNPSTRSKVGKSMVGSGSTSTTSHKPSSSLGGAGGVKAGTAAMKSKIPGPPTANNSSSKSSRTGFVGATRIPATSASATRSTTSASAAPQTVRRFPSSSTGAAAGGGGVVSSSPAANKKTAPRLPGYWGLPPPPKPETRSGSSSSKKPSGISNTAPLAGSAAKSGASRTTRGAAAAGAAASKPQAAGKAAAASAIGSNNSSSSNSSTDVKGGRGAAQPTVSVKQAGSTKPRLAAGAAMPAAPQVAAAVSAAAPAADSVTVSAAPRIINCSHINFHEAMQRMKMMQAGWEQQSRYTA